jgi:glycosyltransferase involved in cell wall biosynthesis
MQPFLGLCMIVRNEAALLDRCLSSTAPHVDEIVIVDTGSTDGTKAVASRYTSRIYDHPWADDFAAARNAAVARSTSAWILMLDADEYLDVADLDELRRFLGSYREPMPAGVVLPVHNFVGEAGSGKISESRAMRLFTRHPDLRFVRPVHEQLESRTGQLRQLEYPLPIYHTGYTSETIAARRKNERNQRILNRMRDTGHYTPYDAYLMGNEHYSQDRYEEALSCYQDAARPAQRDKSWYPSCLGNRIQCLIRLQRYTEAYGEIEEALAIWPEACDFYWLKGHLLAQLGFDESAIAELNRCLAAASRPLPSGQSWLISPNFGSTLPLQQLAVLHLRRFEFAEAVASLTKLAYSQPHHLTALVQLLRLVRQEPPEGVKKLLQSIYAQPDSSQVRMIVEACVQAGWFGLAAEYLGAEPPLAPAPPAASDVPGLARYCMQLFHMEKYEEFDACLQLGDPYESGLAQALGDAFFEERQYELALDFYSPLFNQGRLSGKGYENVARLYLAQDEREEGLEFLLQAIERLPDRIDLYTLYLRHSPPNSEDGERCRRLLMERYPGLRNFPLLT